MIHRKASGDPSGARRSAVSDSDRRDDGPIDRLWRAGWELIQWRDFEGEWQRQTFDRYPYR